MTVTPQLGSVDRSLPSKRICSLLSSPRFGDSAVLVASVSFDGADALSLIWIRLRSISYQEGRSF